MGGGERRDRLARADLPPAGYRRVGAPVPKPVDAEEYRIEVDAHPGGRRQTLQRIPGGDRDGRGVPADRVGHQSNVLALLDRDRVVHPTGPHLSPLRIDAHRNLRAGLDESDDSLQVDQVGVREIDPEAARSYLRELGDHSLAQGARPQGANQRLSLGQGYLCVYGTFPDPCVSRSWIGETGHLPASLPISLAT